MSDRRESSLSSPTLPLPAVAGVKRPAPSLLPAFEPFSSSPSLPRPTKRVARFPPSHYEKEEQRYPTPVPTSSTGILSSSPPPLPCRRRRGLVRTASTLSERAPLSTVPSIELDSHGQPTLMGRSSNSSHYQLSTNKLISRVHVRAVYLAASPPAPQKVLVECLGWNGAKVHCQGKAWELRKGDSFTSETEDADIMVDVQDARVLLQWPKPEPKAVTPVDSDSPWEEDRLPTGMAATHPSLAESPLRRQQRPHSPVSPSPAVNAVHTSSSLPTIHSYEPASVKVYEDEPSEGEERMAAATAEATQSTQVATQSLGTSLRESQSLGASLRESQSSINAEARDLQLQGPVLPESQSSINPEPRDFSDPDEENDPVIHSFGPFGANLLPRMESFTTHSPTRSPLRPRKEATVSPPKHRSSSESTREDNGNPVANHLINQLAFSRLSSTPLSTLMDHLPTYLKVANSGSKGSDSFTIDSLKRLLDATDCVGEVMREGKDAAGKRLESEYYYIPDLDEDVKRRDAVVGCLGKPGLRACRKQHKQYYWRKPKKP